MNAQECREILGNTPTIHRTGRAEGWAWECRYPNCAATGGVLTNRGETDTDARRRCSDMFTDHLWTHK